MHVEVFGSTLHPRKSIVNLSQNRQINRRHIELPSVSTLTRLTSKVKKLEDSQFFHSIFSNIKVDGGNRFCMKQTRKGSQCSSLLHGCLYNVHLEDPILSA